MNSRLLTATLLLSSSLTCFAETFTGYLMPVKRALACKSSSFGLVTAGAKWLPFTPAGNEKAIAFLQPSTKTGDLQVSVQATRQGELLAVESITWK